ncbi:unnamed protein product [Meloidogyne enterolobii]|uniref:Uncharacterized protein n=1 Tax=Meloidogyne enterolobii TaxID=390850 RepID=A0ACB0ZMA5_MELEN
MVLQVFSCKSCFYFFGFASFVFVSSFCFRFFCVASDFLLQFFCFNFLFENFFHQMSTFFFV